MKNTHYSRPLQFSDPFSDFTQEELNKILNKADEALDEYDFMCIFQSLLPAGTYEENSYFIPLLLAFLKKDPDYDVVYNFLLWCFENFENLKKDNLDIQIKNDLENLFIIKTNCFDLKSNEDGYLYPAQSSFIDGIMEGLLETKIWNIHDFTDHLFPCCNYVQAGWIFYIYLKKYYLIGMQDVFLEQDDKKINMSIYFIICQFILCNDDEILKFTIQHILHSNWTEQRKFFVISILKSLRKSDSIKLKEDFQEIILDYNFDFSQYFIEDKINILINKSFKESIINLLEEINIK